jgi:hypothetical protein
MSAEAAASRQKGIEVKAEREIVKKAFLRGSSHG